MTGTESMLEHSANEDQLRAREDIARLFEAAPMALSDKMFNLGLWCRSGLLVKFLAFADLYQRAMTVPGVMCEFGTWLGQSGVLLENCRAIFEPFNKTRKALLFDSFSGYSDGLFGPQMYAAGAEYVAYLERLLTAHSNANVYGHIPAPHRVIVGDVCDTAGAYFRENAHETVALAIFDIGSYKPTKYALRAIKPRLLPGSIILLDEFTLPHGKGEAQAWMEEMADISYTMERVALYPSKTVAVIQ